MVSIAERDQATVSSVKENVTRQIPTGIVETLPPGGPFVLNPANQERQSIGSDLVDCMVCRGCAPDSISIHTCSPTVESFEPFAQRDSIVFRLPPGRPEQQPKNHDREAARNNYYEPLPFHETNLAGRCQIQKVKAIAASCGRGEIRRASRGAARAG